MRNKPNNTDMAVAKVMAQGYTNAEIADPLHYSYKNVKRGSSVLFNELGLSRRNEFWEFLMYLVRQKPA